MGEPKPMPTPLRTLDDATLLRMIRYALRSGGATLHLRPGCRPAVEGMGPARSLRFRQLSVDDTRAAAACLLERSVVPKRLRASQAEGAMALGLCWELPGEALVEPRFETLPHGGGLVLHLDLIPPIPAGMQIEALES
jgi:hypothetical protein